MITKCLSCKMMVEIAEEERTKICPVCFRVGRFLNGLENEEMTIEEFMMACRSLDGFVETIHVDGNLWVQEVLDIMSSLERVQKIF